jgi:hypothetical protein
MQQERMETFNAVDEAGRVHEVEVWADVAYSMGFGGTARRRSVGLKHLRMADSGNPVNTHLDGSLEDSKSGLRMRMATAS